SPSRGVRPPRGEGAQEARTNKMAVNLPLFRKKFPLLVTGSLLALQPLAVPFAFAAEQYDCSASASGGWSCATKSAVSSQLPRPQHSTAAVSTVAGSGAVQPAAGQAQEAQAVLVTESAGRALSSRSADFSHLDWVPREQLNAAQLAEVGPYC